MAKWQTDVTNVSFSLDFFSVITTASFVEHSSVKNAQVMISSFMSQMKMMQWKKSHVMLLQSWQLSELWE